MTISIIDCGTNTFHLLIAETEGRSFRVLYKKNIAVKLAEGGIDKNQIAPAAFERGLNALKEFSATNRLHQVSRITAFATAAVRKAVNGHEFLAAVKEQTGIDVKLIDGDREAELIYYGVRQALNMSGEKMLVMDIGGGSVEFIVADSKSIYWKQSFELGAALLLEKFKPSDPLKTEELLAIEEYLDEQLAPLFIALKQYPEVKILVGSSGSFETFAEMISEQFYSSPFDYADKTEFAIDIHQYQVIHELLLHSTTQQRKAMKGVIDMRVDMIVIASVLLNFVIHNTPIEKLRLSSYALKEGMLYFAMNGQE